MKLNRKLKKPDTSSKLILEEIIGLTIKNANGLASSSSNSSCVYVAGCVVVVYNVDSGAQSHLMVSHRMPKPLSCVALSQNGSFVAAGESGHQPGVLIWDLETLASVFELKGHQYGVSCMDFSPDGKYLVSVGFSHDGYLCLWDWRSGMLAAKVKACSSFSSVASVKFSSDAKFIVTAGKKHLKFWRSSTSSRANARTGSLAIHGKPINIGHHKECSFVDVTSPIWTGSSLVDCNPAGEFSPIHAFTDTGVLCLIHSGFKITNSVDLKVKKGFALSASNKVVACACNNGVIKLFAIYSLKYTGSLQYGEAKRCKKPVFNDCKAKVNESEDQPLPTFPDAIACQFSASEKLVVVYGDHSLYIWDVHDEYKGTKSCVLVSHSACVWDIKNLSCEYMHDPSLACVARGCPGGVSFATCSADGTIRLWDLVLQPESSEDFSSIAKDCSFGITESVGTCLVRAGIFERDSVMSGFSTRGFRSMAVSSEGKHLAAGDCEGNLHLYNLHTSEYIYIQDAHDAEILSLTFSLPVNKDDSSEKYVEGHYFLVSGGRDRMIHIYDVDRNFDLIGSVDDHSAAVTSVKVSGNGCKILSCSADRSLVFRDVAVTDSGYNISRCHNQMASHGTIYDMAVDPMMAIVVTVGKDKKINTFNIAAGKLLRSFKQDGDFGDPIKITMDPSCSYLVCSYSNRSICMYDFLTGEMVARAMGHGEAITGVIFLPDCKHLVSVSGDGCIFVWKVPALFSSKMLQRIEENSCPLFPIIRDQPLALSQIEFLEGDDSLCKFNPVDEAVLENSKSNKVNPSMSCQCGNHQETTTFKFSISRLPKWAQAKVTGPDVIPTRSECTSLQQVGVESLSSSVNAGGYALTLHELQTPSKHNGEYSKQICGSMTKSSPDTDNSQASRTLQEASRNFALDKRWFTIHTVCLDLLNSPEIWDMKKMQVPEPLSNLSGHTAAEVSSDTQYTKLFSGDLGVNYSTLEPTSTIGDHVNRQSTILNNSVNMCSHTNQLETSNACACHEGGLCKVSEHMLPDSSIGGGQTTMVINPSNMESQEDDTSNLNSGNLSENFKTEGRKSSLRRRYSAQFVVQCDLLRGQQAQFGTPIRDFGGTMSSGQNTGPSISSEGRSMLVSEESQRTNTSQQQEMNSIENLLSLNHIISQSDSGTTQSSGNMEVQKVSGLEVCSFEGIEKQDTILSCKEALLKLDSATENALQLFSKLETMVLRENNSTGPEAQLYEEAAEMLPSIAEKVHAVAMLAQSTQNNTCMKSGVDVSSFEPFLGTFAEKISQRVVEILKKNSTTL